MVQRARIRAAVLNWHALNSAQKQALNERAKLLKITGFNLQIREYIAALPPPSFTVFDGGLTVWDTGITQWDGV